jgi:hypothetical protein
MSSSVNHPSDLRHKMAFESHSALGAQGLCPLMFIYSSFSLRWLAYLILVLFNQKFARELTIDFTSESN